MTFKDPFSLFVVNRVSQKCDDYIYMFELFVQLQFFIVPNMKFDSKITKRFTIMINCFTSSITLT
jgi:hypothetical protein